MLTYNFIPQIILPTGINQKYATPIDNIFLNYHEHQCISGNLTTSISGHLSQFIITENLLENTLDRDDHQIEHGDYKNLNTDAFKRDIDLIDWSWFTGKILDKHAPLKKTSRKRQKEIKPWVARGIRQVIFHHFLKKTHRLPKISESCYRS